MCFRTSQSNVEQLLTHCHNPPDQPEQLRTPVQCQLCPSLETGRLGQGRNICQQRPPTGGLNLGFTSNGSVNQLDIYNTSIPGLFQGYYRCEVWGIGTDRIASSDTLLTFEGDPRFYMQSQQQTYNSHSFLMTVLPCLVS